MNNYMFVEHRQSGGLAHVFQCWEDCGSGTDMMEAVVYPASASKTNQLWTFSFLHVCMLLFK